MGVVRTETKLRISAPYLNPFTPNPMHAMSLDSPSLKKRAWKEWAESKPRRYWVFLVMIVLFFFFAIASAIIVLLYFITQHRSDSNSVASPVLTLSPTSTPQVLRFPAASPGSVNSHHVTSYLIDILGGDDEDTRVAVRRLYASELMVESTSHRR